MQGLLRGLFVLLGLMLSLTAWAGVNVNTASQSELEGLPGIGPTKASAIIEHRDAHGPFASLNELDDVPGIGPATLRNLDGMVEFGDALVSSNPDEVTPPAPKATPRSAPATGSRVNINTASQSELETLPGVGPAKALAILGDRETNGAFGSCDDLTRVSGIGPATVANLSERCTAD